MNDMHNFKAAKDKAIDELYQMNRRATENADLKHQNSSSAPFNNSKKLLKNFNLLNSDDELIILGLIMVLSKDCHDKWLFLALLYILL